MLRGTDANVSNGIFVASANARRDTYANSTFLERLSVSHERIGLNA